MPSLTHAFKSTVGRKVLMALTGLALIGFLVAHLTGNFLLYGGPKKFNDYGHALTSTPLLYVAEIGLLVVFFIHVWAAMTLRRVNHDARPEGYKVKANAGHTSRRNLASGNMIISGVVIVIFLVVHIVTLKYGTHYDSPEEGVRDLHKLVLEKFSNPIYSGGYVIAMVILGFHLWHAFGSALQTLGIGHTRNFARLGKLIALVLAIGFLSFPLYYFFMGGDS